MHDYLDRFDAGKTLAEQLRQYGRQQDVIILALPRGGVPVAFEVARSLEAPLDVYVVRKLGLPGHEELAMGAISSGGLVLNDEVIRANQVEQDEIDAVIAHEKEELERRESLYRANRSPLKLLNKIVILVDDGIATGATIKAAIQSIRLQQPKKLVTAVPVVDTLSKQKIEGLVDDFICPLIVDDLQAVGLWYEHFDQTQDSEVQDLLFRAKRFAR